MNTPEGEWKRTQRKLRSIPVDDIAPNIAADEERGGLWCLVAGGLEFIPADGGECQTEWDDGLMYAQFARWVKARPERVHTTREAAVAFVRSHFGGGAGSRRPWSLSAARR